MQKCKIKKSYDFFTDGSFQIGVFMNNCIENKKNIYKIMQMNTQHFTILKALHFLQVQL